MLCALCNGSCMICSTRKWLKPTLQLASANKTARTNMIDEHHDTLSGLMLAQTEERNRGCISSNNQVAGSVPARQLFRSFLVSSCAATSILLLFLCFTRISRPQRIRGTAQSSSRPTQVRSIRLPPTYVRAGLYIAGYSWNHSAMELRSWFKYVRARAV